MKDNLMIGNDPLPMSVCIAGDPYITVSIQYSVKDSLRISELCGYSVHGCYKIADRIRP